METQNQLIKSNKIKNPNELIKRVLEKFNKNDVMVLFIVFILGFINNFVFITTEGVAPDSLSTGNFDIAGEWEISLGRFGIEFVNLLRFGLVNKFIIILISLIFLSLSVMIVIRTFSIKNRILIVLLSALITVAPQFTETYMFIYCADAYCLAFMIATLSGYFLKKADSKKIYYIFSAICIIITCSLYQAYLGVSIGIAIILLINDLLNNKDIKEVVKKGVKYLATIFIAIILYYLILKIIITVLGISLASYKGANNIGLETIRNLPKSIAQAYKDFFEFFFTNKIISNSYWKRKYIYLALLLISFGGMILIFIKNKFKSKYLRILCVLILLAIFPIGVNIMNLIASTTKINLVTGVGIITTYILLLLIYEKLLDNWLENLIKYAYLILLCILIFTFILENTFTYMCRYDTFRNYYAISNNIYNQVTSLDDYSTDMKWMFSDVIRYKAKDRDKANGFISNDNETWNNYNGTHQNVNFFSKYLGVKINVCSKEDYDNIVQTEEFKQMPIYPNAGSIKIINDIIVIKVSDHVFE